MLVARAPALGRVSFPDKPKPTESAVARVVDAALDQRKGQASSWIVEKLFKNVPAMLSMLAAVGLLVWNVARETAAAEHEMAEVRARVEKVEKEATVHKDDGAKSHPTLAVQAAKTETALDAMGQRLDSLERGQHMILRELRQLGGRGGP